MDIPEIRKATHGDFHESSACCQQLKALYRSYCCMGNLSYAQREAIEMIIFKLSRIACGNPDHLDHWEDIAGYATLAIKDIRRGE